MKIFVARRTLGPTRYIGTRGWVSVKRRARNFRSTHDALLFCLDRDHLDTEVVVDFEQPNAANVIIRPSGEAAPPAAADWFDAEHNFAVA